MFPLDWREALGVKSVEERSDIVWVYYVLTVKVGSDTKKVGVRISRRDLRTVDDVDMAIRDAARKAIDAALGKFV
jgi:hypothetical protein